MVRDDCFAWSYCTCTALTDNLCRYGKCPFYKSGDVEYEELKKYNSVGTIDEAIEKYEKSKGMEA